MSSHKPPEPGSPESIVNTFIAAIERCDIDTAAALADEHISYENVPMQPIVGRDALKAALGAFLGATTNVDWRILRQLAVGNVVVNERIDRFEVNGGWLELPVAGFFEVTNGHITLWRDYFDLASYTNRIAELTAK
jgi:limonene-1,2-epoxide hydrolase